MKAKIFILLMIILFVVAGCVDINNSIAHDKSFPSDGRYKILGPVNCEGRKTVVLGLFWGGGIGYKDLYETACEKYKTRDLDVINVSVDENVMSVLGIVVNIYITMRGTAIVYNDKP